MPEIQETNKGTGIKGKSTTRQANTGKLTLLTYTQGNDVIGGSWSKLREVTGRERSEINHNPQERKDDQNEKGNENK